MTSLERDHQSHNKPYAITKKPVNSETPQKAVMSAVSVGPRKCCVTISCDA